MKRHTIATRATPIATYQRTCMGARNVCGAAPRNLSSLLSFLLFSCVVMYIQPPGVIRASRVPNALGQSLHRPTRHSTPIRVIFPRSRGVLFLAKVH